jgi:hypothetical protein
MREVEAIVVAPTGVTMEVFRDLHITIEPDRMAAIAGLIERSPPTSWTRDRAAEGRMRAVPVLKSRPAFCFTCTAEGPRPAATLILAQKDAASFTVSNIIPVSRHQLAYGEYNTILEDFYERALRPYTGAGGVTANLTSSSAELEHWMSAGTAKKLRRFSACANKGTGSSHPHDRQRWNNFVLAAYRDGSKMGASDLRRWLIELEGWPAEVADQLALEYEFGRELLAFADSYRRSA